MNSPAKHRMFLPFATALALAIAVSGSVAAQTTIGAGGGDSVQSWGKDDTQTYGQTITTPTDNVLTDFSFWLGPTSTNFPDPLAPSLDFRAYVYAWSGTSATGSALYTSGINTHNATPTSSFTQYMFTTGGLSLVPGNTYALFLSTSGLTGTGRVQWEAAISEQYSGGEWVFLNNGENTADWTGSTWNIANTDDVRFEANFVASVVPEPSTWILLVAGLLALAFVAWRSRREHGLLTEV